MCIRLAARSSLALVRGMHSDCSARISPLPSETLPHSLGCRSRMWRLDTQHSQPLSKDRLPFRKPDRALAPAALGDYGQVHSSDYTSIVKPCFWATDLINRENVP